LVWGSTSVLIHKHLRNRGYARVDDGKMRLVPNAYDAPRVTCCLLHCHHGTKYTIIGFHRVEHTRDIGGQPKNNHAFHHGSEFSQMCFLPPATTALKVT
jgi:hypothetical protein